MILAPLSPLVYLLRAEIDAYGGLLAAFERQQELILKREIDEANEVARSIEKIAQEASHRREAREGWVEDFASSHAQSSTARVQELLPYFPEEQRPLFEALIKEINHLIRRVRRRAQQNHGLLARAVEFHRELLERFHPSARPRTYAPSGQVAPLLTASGLRAHG